MDMDNEPKCFVCGVALANYELDNYNDSGDLLCSGCYGVPAEEIPENEDDCHDI